MRMSVRMPILGAILGVGWALITAEPAHAAMIGAGEPQTTEAAPLVQLVRRCRTGRRIHDCNTTPEELRRRREESERKKREAATAGTPISDRRCRTGRRIHDCNTTPEELRRRREESGRYISGSGRLRERREVRDSGNRWRRGSEWRGRGPGRRR
jgi:hypothetical protein